MKAVIIGASGEALHTIEKAHAYGIRVIALDGNPRAAGLAAADKGLVTDISREAELIEAVRRERPDFVLTVPIGRYLTSVGAVNDALSLPGITRRMAQSCTDKFLFHRTLAAAGLRNCRCFSLEGKAPEGLDPQYPAILKPRYGSGSRGIHLVKDPKELSAALEEIGEEAYVLEDCVPGEEYGVDAAVTGGRFHMVLLRRKVNTPPPARQAVGYFACGREDAFWQPAREYMEKAVRCLGLQECLIHADLIQSETGPFAIELSARPSGHNLHNLFTPLAAGIDPAEEYIRYRIGEAYTFTPETVKPMMIHYFDGAGAVKHVPDRKEIEALLRAEAQRSGAPPVKLVHWQCALTVGETLPPVSDGHSLMGRGCYILEGGGRERLLALAEEIMKGML